MRSKEEILKKHLQDIDVSGVPNFSESLFVTISEYAKQEAIGFNEWIIGEKLRFNLVLEKNNNNELVISWIDKGTDSRTISTSELYSLYTESKK